MAVEDRVQLQPLNCWQLQHSRMENIPRHSLPLEWSEEELR